MTDNEKIIEECLRVERLAIEHRDHPVDEEDSIGASVTIQNMEYTIRFVKDLMKRRMIKTKTIRLDGKEGQSMISAMADRLFQAMVRNRQIEAMAELDLEDPAATIRMTIEVIIA